MSVLRNMARDICEKVWGFRPVRQIKPVHLANGLFQKVCGESGSPTIIQKIAGGFREGNSELSSEDVMREYADAFTVQTRGPVRDQVNDLRSALDLVLSQDRSMYANGPFTVTLTHRLLTSTDPSDEKAGEFLAQLLASDVGGGTISVLRSCLESQHDNTYLLTVPLLRPRNAGPAPTPGHDTEARIAASPVLQSVLRAFRVLSMHEPLLEKTEFLQRIVTLGSFSLYLYLINRENSNGHRVPLLMCAPNPSDQIREASRSTFTRARQRIRHAFASGIREELHRGGQDTFDVASYKSLFRSWLPDLGLNTPDGKKQSKIWESFIQDFDTHLLGTGTATEAFVSAVVPAMFMALTEEPPEAGTMVGRLCGLVYPRVQGRGEKYYSPSPSFLDMLVTALLKPEEEVSADEFWERAWNEFGLSCGARGTIDARRLAQVGVRQASPVQFEENAREMVFQLTAMGHARQLPDDVAMVRGIGRQRG